MKKRITAFLLTAVMLLGALAGCGGPANNSGDGSGDGGSANDGPLDLNSLTLDQIVEGAKAEGKLE